MIRTLQYLHHHYFINFTISFHIRVLFFFILIFHQRSLLVIFTTYVLGYNSLKAANYSLNTLSIVSLCKKILVFVLVTTLLNEFINY